MRNWASKGGFGERIWTEGDRSTFPPEFLSKVSTVTLGFQAVGLNRSCSTDSWCSTWSPPSPVSLSAKLRNSGFLSAACARGSAADRPMRRSIREFILFWCSPCSAFVPQTRAISRNTTTSHDTSESGPEQRKPAFQQLASLRGSSLTTQGSAVRTRHRPQRERAGQRSLSKLSGMRTHVQRGAKSNKNPTSEPR